MGVFKYDGARALESGNASAAQYSTGASETLTGTNGSDNIWGGAGDLLRGGLGNDTYTLGSLDLRIEELPGQGIDTVAGWASLDLANFKNIENVRVNGNDLYAAGNEVDNIVEGDGGSQQLYGGLGQDVMIGGGGADTFIVVKGQGNDVIQDFSADDTVRLSAGFTSFAEVHPRLSQVGVDVKLDIGDGDGLLFRKTTVAQLGAENFQLTFDAAKLGALTFEDDFNGSLSLWDAESNPNGVWRPDYGFSGSQGAGSYTLASNGEKQIYTSPYFRDHNGDFAESPFVSNDDGTLSIWAKASTNAEIFGYSYTSGAMTTKHSFAQTYGYFEMRADLPEATGAWPAFWLVAADGTWPPELDIMETLTHDPRVAHTTEHSGVGGVHTQHGYGAYIPESADGFHTYGVKWTATSLTWFIDGVEVFQTATPADMHKPMFMIANMALGGWGGPVDPADIPAEMKIDYIRAYALDDGTPAPLTAAVVTPAAAAFDAPQGVLVTSARYGDTLNGGAGADTISAGRGPDLMTGGAGADLFIIRDTPWSAGHITDFQIGVDRLDFSGVYTDGYAGADPVADGRLMFLSDGQGGAKVMVDIDGASSVNPWPFQIAILDGVSPTGLTAASLAGGPAITAKPALVTIVEPAEVVLEPAFVTSGALFDLSGWSFI